MSAPGLAKQFLDRFRTSRGNEYAVGDWALSLLKYTGLSLFTAAALCTYKQFFGDPIYCDTEEVHVAKDLFEHYCWMQASFVAPKKFIANTQLRHQHDESERIYQNYYQWIHFILFFQGVLCYLPYHFWKNSENGKTAYFMKLMNGGDGPSAKRCDDNDEDPDTANIVALARSLTRRKGSHCSYALKYLISQAMCIASLVLQLYLMDLMMGGDFMTLGSQLLSLNTEEDYKDFDKNPLLRVFPRLIRCWFEEKLGMSGTFERYAALCILPVNIFNEKIFTFVWFWFIFATAFCSLHLLLSLLAISYSGLRGLILKFHASPTTPSLTYALERLTEMSDFGDWFLLMQLRRNMDPTSFKVLLEELAHQLAAKAARFNNDYPTFSPLRLPPRNVQSSMSKEGSEAEDMKASRV